MQKQRLRIPNTIRMQRQRLHIPDATIGDVGTFGPTPSSGTFDTFVFVVWFLYNRLVVLHLHLVVLVVATFLNP
jgi:hypothetical protein